MQTYSAKEPPPPPEEREFPMEVRHKKAASVVIYEGQEPGKGDVYNRLSVRWPTATADAPGV
jgi:hypothetical protein